MMYNLLTGIFGTFGDRSIGTFVSIIDHNYLFKKYFIEPAWVYASELLSDAKNGLEKQLDNFLKDIENIVQSIDSDFLLSNDQDINDKENQSSQWSKIVILYWLIQNQEIHRNMGLKKSIQGFDDDRIIKRDASFYDEKFSRETGSHNLNSFFEINPYAIELKTEYDDAGEKKNFTEYSVANLDNYLKREVSPMLEIETKDRSISNQTFRLSNELFKGIDKGSKLSLISISDDSMEPKLSIEDKIIFEEISKDDRNWIKEIEFGKMYVVRTGDDYNVRNLVKPGSLKSGFVNIQTINSDWPSAEEVDISNISSLEIIGPVRGIIKTE